jgi:hypothetical protein
LSICRLQASASCRCRNISTKSASTALPPPKSPRQRDRDTPRLALTRLGPPLMSPALTSGFSRRFFKDRRTTAGGLTLHPPRTSRACKEPRAARLTPLRG